MKLTGTIRGRKIVAFVERRPENPKAPHVKIYDTTDQPEGGPVAWRDCEIGALWAYDVEEFLGGTAPPPRAKPTRRAPAPQPPGPSDDGIPF